MTLIAESYFRFYPCLPDKDVHLIFYQNSDDIVMAERRQYHTLKVILR